MFFFHVFGQLKKMSFQQVFLLISIEFLLSSVRVILGEVGRGVVVCAGGFGKLSLSETLGNWWLVWEGSKEGLPFQKCPKKFRF